MRKIFADLLHKKMIVNPNIYLITADLGYGLWDKIKDDFPQRFFNVGSSEMVMMGMGIGLAMENKIPFVYSITPFAIFRPFEMIRNYLNNEKIPVNIIGGGRNKDYGYLGFSHYAEDDLIFIKNFKNIKIYYPNEDNELEANLNSMIKDKLPSYINLRK